MTGRYDVIIIGSGAGGATLAARLAPHGLRILLLERGGHLPSDGDAAEVYAKRPAETWTDFSGGVFAPRTHHYVGGATKLYGAALYRLRAEDFGEGRHHDGISPAWPIPYEDLEPYYTLAEELYQVHGARGEDPTEPPASAPYPYPAVAHEPRVQQLADDLAATGLRPFHSPAGVVRDGAETPYGGCQRCGTGDGRPCLAHGKADAEVSAVRAALRHANVTLLTHATAVRLETDAAGTTVRHVVVEQDRVPRLYSADIVAVSCGAANSAKLLLASASEAHPGGLANGSDEVGRNFMCHVGQAVLALSREPNPTVFQQTLGLHDFYFGGPDFDYPMGSVQLGGRSRAAMFRGETELESRLAATWSLDDVAAHAVDFWLSTEDLPRSENRVTLTAGGGIRLRYRPSNTAASKALYQQLGRLLGAMRMHEEHLIPRSGYGRESSPVAGVANQAGTCRFGIDPATSVLDLNCRAHELDNLYVVDASFLPSTGAVNPALTVMANAIRVGDHLLDRLGAGVALSAGLAGGDALRV